MKPSPSSKVEEKKNSVLDQDNQTCLDSTAKPRGKRERDHPFRARERADDGSGGSRESTNPQQKKNPNHSHPSSSTAKTLSVASFVAEPKEQDPLPPTNAMTAKDQPGLS